MAKQKIHIELFEESPIVGVYVLRYEGETDDKFTLFVKKYMCSHTLDIERIVTAIDQFKNFGTQEERFRPESKISDMVMALPDRETKGVILRLYCLRISDQIVILGFGGVKTTRTYQQDPLLNSAVEELKKINNVFYDAVRQRNIQINGTELIGNLILEIDI